MKTLINLCHSLVASLLIYLLPINSYATVTQNFSQKELNEVLKRINSQKFDFTSVVSMVGEKDPKKAEQLKKWLDKYPGTELNHPKFTLKGNYFVTIVGNQELQIAVHKNMDIEFIWQNKKTTVNYNMPVEEMADKVAKDLGFSLKEKFSFTDFFIDEAHAIVEVWIWLFAIIAAFFVCIKLDNLAKAITLSESFGEDAAKFCSELSKLPADHYKLYALLKDVDYTKNHYCSKVDPKANRPQSDLDRMKVLCRRSTLAYDCLAKKLVEVNEGIDNSSRKSKGYSPEEIERSKKYPTSTSTTPK